MDQTIRTLIPLTVLSLACAAPIASGQELLSGPYGDRPAMLLDWPRATAEFDRRLSTAKGDGLLARIARDRAARPEIYRRLIGFYAYTPVGDPRSVRGLHAPNLRPEDRDRSLALPWCYLYLRPRFGDTTLDYHVPVGQALRAIGGADFVGAVRLQLEASLAPGLDTLGQSIKWEQERYLGLALELGGQGLAVFADAVPRIRAQRAENKNLPRLSSDQDPVDALARAAKALADQKPEFRTDIALLKGSLRDAKQRSVLLQLERAMGSLVDPPTVPDRTLSPRACVTPSLRGDENGASR